jgi:Glyoxalase-like domain
VVSASLDHLVIAAPSLAAGAKMLHDALGIWPQPGGEHVRMGTHNSLLRLGESLYLEVIAINPAVAKPCRARWFRLDELALECAPRLVTWVVRCNDIQSAHLACNRIHGEIEQMSRGDLNWNISIPGDGGMPFDGVLPALIEWQSPQHPASRLEDRGCTLLSLAGFHPDAERINELLNTLGISADIRVETHRRPHLVVTIKTPSGVRTIGA